MKKIIKISFICLLALFLSLFIACGDNPPVEEPKEFVDFAKDLKLNMNSSTVKEEVKGIKAYIDGDTTHFYVSESIVSGGILKARYLAINTPESTGQIEEWGKKASNLTRERLSSAVSIILESDNDKWNLDSTGGRYLVWVWYKTSSDGEYKNLNLEILQSGLAFGSNSSDNIYGDICSKALSQAIERKLYVFSDEKDPDFFYGEAIQITLKELRCNLEKYNGTKVSFEGVIIKKDGGSVYIQEYDPLTDIYYAIGVYYGYGLDPFGLRILSTGNRVKMVGTVQYYEEGGTYQISGVEYDMIDPSNPNSFQLISKDNEIHYNKLDLDRFFGGTIDIVVDDEENIVKTFNYNELMMNSGVYIEGADVTSIYTTGSNSASEGAMTITCKIDGKTINVRTIVLLNENNELVTEDEYLNKTINVRGLIDYFNGDYQIKVYSYNDIVIQDE